MSMSEATSGATGRKVVYAVTEKGEKSFWTKVGMGFPNRDGSMTLRLDAMPLSGTLQIRDEEPGRRGGGA